MCEEQLIGQLHSINEEEISTEELIKRLGKANTYEEVARLTKNIYPFNDSQRDLIDAKKDIICLEDAKITNSRSELRKLFRRAPFRGTAWLFILNKIGQATDNMKELDELLDVTKSGTPERAEIIKRIIALNKQN